MQRPTRREKIAQVVRNKISQQARARLDSSDLISKTELSLLLSGHDSCHSQYTDMDSALLVTIAKRTLAKEMRYQGRQKRNFQADKPISESVPDDALTAAEISQRKELFSQINREILRLGATYWRIYYMRFICNATISEICETLGLTRRKVDTHFQTIYRQIRKKLTCQGDSDFNSR